MFIYLKKIKLMKSRLVKSIVKTINISAVALLLSVFVLSGCGGGGGSGDGKNTSVKKISLSPSSVNISAPGTATITITESGYGASESCVILSAAPKDGVSIKIFSAEKDKNDNTKCNYTGAVTATAAAKTATLKIVDAKDPSVSASLTVTIAGKKTISFSDVDKKSGKLPMYTGDIKEITITESGYGKDEAKCNTLTADFSQAKLYVRDIVVMPGIMHGGDKLSSNVIAGAPASAKSCTYLTFVKMQGVSTAIEASSAKINKITIKDGSDLKQDLNLSITTSNIGKTFTAVTTKPAFTEDFDPGSGMFSGSLKYINNKFYLLGGSDVYSSRDAESWAKENISGPSASKDIGFIMLGSFKNKGDKADSVILGGASPYQMMDKGPVISFIAIPNDAGGYKIIKPKQLQVKAADKPKTCKIDITSSFCMPVNILNLFNYPDYMLSAICQFNGKNTHGADDSCMSFVNLQSEDITDWSVAGDTKFSGMILNDYDFIYGVRSSVDDGDMVFSVYSPTNSWKALSIPGDYNPVGLMVGGVFFISNTDDDKADTLKIKKLKDDFTTFEDTGISLSSGQEVIYVAFAEGVHILDVCIPDPDSNSSGCKDKTSRLYRSIDRGSSWTPIVGANLPSANNSDGFSYGYGNDMLVLVFPEGKIWTSKNTSAKP